ncbi:MAG: trimethylamine methyltransferase family protein [Alphaproteobacteria bacterium]|nr:trimethylamine methyltransferase family protein [Alphaproteobacteria bacterium]
MVRRRRRNAEADAEEVAAPPQPPPMGGRFQPLAPNEVEAVIAASFAILETVGMAGLPDKLTEGFLCAGAWRRPDGRLCFPKAMVAEALARAPRRVSLPGFVEDHGLEVGGGRVHIGTGGAAVQVLDSASGRHRDATLNDLYGLMRVLDASPNIHYGVRPAVARDMPGPYALDINTAFACLKGTAKPIGVSFDSSAHVDPVIGLFDAALGAEGAFRKRPFCMAIVVHVVPPLRFADEGVEVLGAAIHAGMVPQICSAGQAGATSPVTLAGALAQGLAESLAGLLLVDLIKPGGPCIYAFMPFISDLRTGAMSGGGGEAAVANAAAAQLLAALGLPSTVSAGMTDAKIADAQAGYEKGHSVALAAEAGADMINLSVGMLGSIMVASPEALVIDDDMAGAILRAVRGVEVSDATLNLDEIERVVTGAGHYLGESETLARMKTDYVYPSLADRRSVADWSEAGGLSIWDRAQARVGEILAAPTPSHLSRDAEARVRAAFPIRLPEEA